MGRGNQCMAKKMSQSTSAVSIHTCGPLRRCCWMTVWGTQRALLVKHLEGHRWWACYTQSRRHLAEGWHHRCVTHCDMEWGILPLQCKENLLFVLVRCKNKADAYYHVILQNVEAKTLTKLWNVLLMKHSISDLIFWKLNENYLYLIAYMDVLPKTKNKQTKKHYCLQATIN